MMSVYCVCLTEAAVSG